MVGAVTLWLKWAGHLCLNWMGQLWQCELLFFRGGDMHKKLTGLQGSIISSHRMNTAFCPFELPRIRAYAEMDKDEVF